MPVLRGIRKRNSRPDAVPPRVKPNIFVTRIDFSLAGNADSKTWIFEPCRRDFNNWLACIGEDDPPKEVAFRYLIVRLGSADARERCTVIYSRPGVEHTPTPGPCFFVHSTEELYRLVIGSLMRIK